MPQSVWKHVAIVGGGPAGSVAAIRLRRHGIRVTLFEKASFPRTKVCGCCLGPAAHEALRQVNGDVVLQYSSSVTRWIGAIDGRRGEFRLRGHFALSRERLDSELLRLAAEAGVRVHQPVSAVIEHMNDAGVNLRTGDDRSQTFDGVLIASGLSGMNLTRWLPWEDEPSGPYGVALSIPSWPEFPGDAVVMACDRNGYVGMVRLEDGRVDVAAALSSADVGDGRVSRKVGRSPRDRIFSVIRDGPFDGVPAGWNELPMMTTAKLRRRRLAGRGRILAIGDAAGYAEPFTGEGMTWAMQSALAAADFVARSTAPPARLADAWPGVLAKLLRRRQRPCVALGQCLAQPAGRSVLGIALSTAPRLAELLVRFLDRGPDYSADPFHVPPSTSD